MAHALAQLYTLEAFGLTHDEALATLLEGGMGRTVPLAELLAELRDPHKMLRLARSAALHTNDLRTACTALVAQGIHPLSLLLGGDPAFRQWLAADDGGWRFHLRAQPLHADLRWGQATVRNFQPTPWLTNLPPGLRLVVGPEAETVVLSDCTLSNLLDPETEVGVHLRLQACEGNIQVPARVHGRLQLRFNEARFLFPCRQDLDGILEIVACPGVLTLPETLRTAGLYLQHCHGLALLPDRIEGARQIDLANLPITAFPDGVENLSYLRLAGMPHLRVLPLPSGAPLDADLVALPALTRLRAPATGTLRNLRVAHCDHLQALPAGLNPLTGSLTLDHLPTLTRLPEDLRVDGDLRIAGCPRLKKLPRGLSVGGEVDLEEAPHLA